MDRRLKSRTENAKAKKVSRARRRDLRLEDCGLFAIISPRFLAARLTTPKMTFTEANLRQLAASGGNYNIFPKKMKNGKTRLIQEPKAVLQRLHARTHDLLSRVEAPNYLHSTVKRRSYISNATTHSASVETIKIDIKSFFPSVPKKAVFIFFHEMLECRKDVAGLMADLLTYQGHLPTGSSSSPIIAFYSFKRLFDEIYEFAKRHDLKMTCYVDDITISGPGANKGLLHEVREIISRYGLKSHKARYFDRYKPRVVTGVCISDTGQRVPNELHLKISRDFGSLFGPGDSAQKSKTLRTLLGRLESAGLIEPAFKARATTLRRKALGDR